MVWNKEEETKTMLNTINGIVQLLRYPLYLTSYSLIETDNDVKDILAFEINTYIEYYLNDFLSAVSFTQTLVSSKKSFLKSTKEIYNNLDGSNFCSELVSLYLQIEDFYKDEKYNFTLQQSITEEICTKYQAGMLNRGLTQALYYIYQTFNKIYSSQIPITNVETVIDTLYINQVFIAPAIEGLLIELEKSISNSFKNYLIFLIVFYVCYVIVAIICHFIFWSCFFDLMRKEIIKSRGMLKLMPMELIKKLKVMKTSGENPTISNSLKFFKQIHKRT